MNKRIRELLEQAGFRYIKDERIGWAGNYNASLPKFAELIIQECAQVSENDITDGDACCTNTAARIARQIKQHFGVE